jgi:8-oxo-dGTP diphosphatase
VANNLTPISAAGAVLWRPSRKHGIKVALVHRPRYDDWSLPKGKARRGESMPVTAIREVAEETGFVARLGRQIVTVNYPVTSGQKTVHYFAARSVQGRFRANHEVDALAWLPLAKARKRLSYRFDRTVLDSFSSLPAELSCVILVRHARAGQRDSFTGDDAQRPLDAKGLRQAAELTEQLLAFGPSGVSSAPLVRCRQTVTPLAELLGLAVGEEPALSEVEYQHDPASARRRVLELALREGTSGPAVVCSQGGAIPGVVKSLASRAHLPLATTATPKGAWWVLSFEGKQLRQADRYVLSDG